MDYERDPSPSLNVNPLVTDELWGVIQGLPFPDYKSMQRELVHKLNVAISCTSALTNPLISGILLRNLIWYECDLHFSLIDSRGRESLKLNVGDCWFEMSNWEERLRGWKG